jgi:hypothetical protein
MPTNEEGEFELILGNRQLLSVFFIVVVLLGVFFTMGYIVGRNTMPGSARVASAKSGQPLVVEPPPSSPAPADPSPSSSSPPDSPRPSPAGSSAPPPEPPKDTPPASTQARPPEAPKSDPPKAAAKAETPKPPAVTRAEPPKPVASKPEPPKPAATGAPGQYLQVAATRKAEADLLAEVLGKKGYVAVVIPVPDAALFRVLVGPLSDADIPKTREALTAAGFKPFPRKL